MPRVINPVLCAACGAALAYYVLSPLYRAELITTNALLVLAFVPLAVLCLFRVLASLAVELPQALFEDIHSDTISRKIRRLRLVPLRITAFAAGLALGIGAGTKAVQPISFGIPEHTVRGISGVALDDPRLVSGGRAMTTLSLRMSTGDSGARVTARGEITVFFPEENAMRLREFGRGTEIFAEGILRDGFGNGYMFSAESLHVTQAAAPLQRFRTNLRLGLTERFVRAASGDGWGGLALALLLGIRDNLDAGIASLYRDSGCSHILALSGMHLAVLAAIISFLLKRVLGLRLAAITGALLIAAYCYIVGPLPSLNRAALMYMLGVLAVLGMLKRDPLSLLCMAFVVQILITPQAGLSLSFILSYLALAGILTIGIMLNDICKGAMPFFLLSSISASIGAFVATAGVTAWFFGVLRPVGILASLILTPLTTLFMIVSIAWLGLDIALPSISMVLSRPLSLLYWLMEKTALLSSRVPGISGSPWLVLSLSLLIVVLLIWLFWRRRTTGNRLEPFA